MNYRIIFHTTGKVLLVEAGLLALPLLVSVLYHERCAWAVLASMAAAAENPSASRDGCRRRRKKSKPFSPTGSEFGSSVRKKRARSRFLFINSTFILFALML